MPALNLTLQVSTMETEEGWTAYEHQLGIAAVEATEEKAEERLRLGIDLVLDSFHDGTQQGRDLMFEYLRQHDVPFWLERPQMQPIRPPHIALGAVVDFPIAENASREVPHRSELVNVG